MQLNCTWRYDGRNFNSEQDLDNYLIRNNLSQVSSQSDVVFERASRNNKTILKIDEAGKIAREKLDLKRSAAVEAMQRREINRTEAIENQTVDDTPVEASIDDYSPVSEYVYNTGQLERLNVNDYVSSRLTLLSERPTQEDLDKISEVKIKNPELLTNEEIFNKVVDNELVQWKYIRKTGKALDKLFGIVINLKHQYHNYFVDADGNFNVQEFIDQYADWKDSNGYSWYDLEGLYEEELQPDGSLKKVSTVLQSFVNQVLRLKTRELNLKLNDKIFYQYVADYAITPDESLGIRGKMDLVVVRSGGRVDIYDIKLSSKDARGLGPGTEWDVDKIKATEYLLAFYGRMMENLGIDPSRISLNVIPIQLRNIKNSTAGDIRVSAPILIEPRAEVQRFVNETIPVELKSSPKSEEIRQSVKESLERMFPTMLINNLILNVNDDYFFNTNKIRKQGNKFVFTDHTNEVSRLVYADTREEILDKYKEYLKGTVEDANGRFNFIRSSLRRALEDFDNGQEPSDTIFGDKIPANILLNFKKYFSNEGWQIAEVSPEINDVLNGLNVILLYNLKKGVYDVISLSALDLDRPIKMKYGSTIYGNFKNDNLVIKNARLSSLGNVLLMRNMAIANALTQAMPNIDFVFGDISVLDARRDSQTSYGKMWTLPAYKITEDAKILHGLAGNQYNLTNNNVTSINEYVEDLFSLIMRATNNTSYDALPGTRLTLRLSSQLGNMFGTFENLDSEYDKIEMLRNLWTLLNDIKSKNNISIDRLMQSPDFDGYIYRETARLVALHDKTFMDLYNFSPMEKWGFENFMTAFSRRSFLNGTMTMTIDTIPIAETVHEAILKTAQRIRSRVENYKTSKNRQMFKLGGLDTNTSMFDVKRYYDMSEEGKLMFLFKNPDTDASLTQDEKTFLTWYLDELNTRRSGKNLTDEEVKQLKESKEYFKVPLLRRSNYSRIANSRAVAKALNPVEQYKEAGDNLYNLRNAAIGQEEYFNEESDYRDMIRMYNTFNATEGAREKLLTEAQEDVFDRFEAHPEIILDNFVISQAVAEQYDRVLPSITAAIACLNALGFSSGINVEESYKFINDYIKSSIFNESLLPKNQIIQAISVVKSKVSGAILGFNPLSGAKEVANGIYYHYTRAVANKIAGNKDKVGISDMMKAYSTVWVDAGKQIGTITKMELLNNRFGFSNMDINSLASNYNYYKDDPLRFNYSMYWFNRAPDFLNRMTIFVGYMYKYGAYDAYTVDLDTQQLKYDWKKDGRFNLLASNDQSNMSEYLAQRSLYSKMMEDLIEQGYEYRDPETGKYRALRWDSNNFNAETNDQLPEGFTNKQIRAFKQESDRAFGYMDHDTKSMIFKLGITAVFFLFKTFATAKLSQWLLKPGTYDQGYYKNAKDPVTGELLYKRVYQNEDGTWDVEFVTTQFIEQDGRRIELEPVTEWVGSPMEGIFWSMMDLFSPFTLLDPQKRNEMWSDPQKRANLLIAMQEIGLILLIYWLISALYPDEDIRNIDNFFERNALTVLNNSSSDLNPITTIFQGNLNLDFTAFDYAENIIPEIWGAMTGQDNRSWYRVATRFGASSMFRKDLYDSHREEQAQR